MALHPHSLASVARELGRFEMQLNPTQRVMHYERSEMSVAQFVERGLADAASIHVTDGSYFNPLRPEMLEKIGRKVAGGWRIEKPARGNLTVWKRLIESDMPIVLESPISGNWIERTISGMHRPTIYLNENGGLSNRAHQLCRGFVKTSDNVALIAFGLYREIFSFFGHGEIFERALQAMSNRPPDMWDFTDELRQNYLRGAFRLIRKSAKGEDAVA